jgi:flagellar hook-associated protein 3 FlgL
MRITTNMMSNRVRTNLAASAERLMKSQDEVSSGKRIRRPSDDIPGIGRDLSLRSAISSIDQYEQNADLASAYLSVTSTSMDTAVKAVESIISLAQTANDSQTAEARKAIANQIGLVSNQLVEVANTRHLGIHIFAGSQTGTAPIAANPAGTPPYIYQGNTVPMTVQVGSETYIPATITADQVFNMSGAAVPGTPDLFQSISELQDKILTGKVADISESLKTLQPNLSNLIGARSLVGARLQHVESSKNLLLDANIGLKDMLSKVEDVDTAEAILQLRQRENVYQAAVATAGRVIQSSLADYLK